MACISGQALPTGPLNEIEARNILQNSSKFWTCNKYFNGRLGPGPWGPFHPPPTRTALQCRLICNGSEMKWRDTSSAVPRTPEDINNEWRRERTEKSGESDTGLSAANQRASGVTPGAAATCATSETRSSSRTVTCAGSARMSVGGALAVAVAAAPRRSVHELDTCPAQQQVLVRYTDFEYCTRSAVTGARTGGAPAESAHRVCWRARAFRCLRRTRTHSGGAARSCKADAARTPRAPRPAPAACRTARVAREAAARPPRTRAPRARRAPRAGHAAAPRASARTRPPRPRRTARSSSTALSTWPYARTAGGPDGAPGAPAADTRPTSSARASSSRSPRTWPRRLRCSRR